MIKEKKEYNYQEVYDNTLEYFKGDELATTVWISKYCLKELKDDGTTIYYELTPDDMHKRLAKEFASVLYERNWNFSNEKIEKLSETGKEVFSELKENFNNKTLEDYIYYYFKDFKYIIPGGSILAGLGSKTPVSLSNCFFNGGAEDNIDSILDVAKSMANIGKRRGGTSTDISNLRPRGASINNSAKTSTGAVSWMQLYDTIGKLIGQEGRKMAEMITIDVNHPDIEEFITIKNDLTKITNANISIKINDQFMDAAEKDNDYFLRWPCDINTDKFDINAEYNVLNPIYENNKIVGYYKKIKAKKVWDLFIKSNYKYAEPGLLNWSRILDYDPTSVYEELKPKGTNPCCFAKNSRVDVITDKGVKDIKDITSDDLVWLEGENKFVPTSGYFDAGKADAYKVTFLNGSELTITENHKLAKAKSKREDGKVKYEGFELVELKKLNVGDKIKADKSDYTIIKSIELVGVEEIGCIEVPNYHYFTANSIISGNSELPLGNFDSCRLICSNMYSLVDKPFTKNANINYNLANKIFYITQILGDAIVDMEIKAVDKIIATLTDNTYEKEMWNKIRNIGINGRRTGCGITAYGDMLAAVDSNYGEANITKDIFNSKFIQEIEASIDLSILYDPFPFYNKNNEYSCYHDKIIGNNSFYNDFMINYEKQFKRMINYGRRNSGISTIAPTGTLSLMTQTTSGMEPLFMPYYVRRKKCDIGEKSDFVDQNGVEFREFLVIHPKLNEWIKTNYPDNINNLNENILESLFKQSPWYNNTANSVDSKIRVKTQSLIQKYITASISSTVNLPKSTPIEKVDFIYKEAFKSGCKGITCYVDGSRSGVLVSKETANKQENNKICISNSVTKRPKLLPAKVVRFNNVGEKWVSVIGILNDKPYEIFTGLLDKLNIPQYIEDGFIIKNKIQVKVINEENKEENKLVSRYDFQYKEKNGEIITVNGLSETFRSEFWNYAKLISGLLRHNMPIEYIIKVISDLKLDSNSINSWKNGVIRTLKRFIKDGDTGEKCPECGGKIIRENGCYMCADCGHSKCG